MATGADIPPELFKRILEDVCEDASDLLNLNTDVPNRKKAVKNVTACSLTCVYWAQICRQKLFGTVWIKSYEDMRAFSSLVANTPKRFQPISNYVGSAYLEQRVGDRPWIHLLRMQPSLFPCKYLQLVLIIFKGSGSTNVAVASHYLTYRRLFTGLPRTPPPFCLQCDRLSIENARFVAPYHLTSLLGILSTTTGELRLHNVIWDAQARFASNLLTSEPLQIPEDIDFSVTVRDSQYLAEAAWIAFATRFRRISQSTILPPLHRNPERSISAVKVLRILSPAQQAILGICTLLSQISKVPRLHLNHSNSYEPERVVLSTDRGAVVKDICGLHISGARPDAMCFDLFFRFCHADPVGGSDSILTVEHISILCITVYAVSDWSSTSSPSGDSSTGRQHVVSTYPWEDIVGICAGQEGFVRLQLMFQNRTFLVQFMQTQRAALAKLNGRIRLFYEGDGSRLAADFETLNALPGDAKRDHGYIHSYYSLFD
ncbi:hypothetical protein BC629DRAFT_1592334 [Irpex lacteus]|nr:hypothetical protein BC629DRAFT_1592334 [Irpex lacteus]